MISFLRSIESAKAPPKRVAGIWATSWTIPRRPSITPDPVSSYSHTPNPIFRICIVTDDETPESHIMRNPENSKADHGLNFRLEESVFSSDSLFDPSSGFLLKFNVGLSIAIWSYSLTQLFDYRDINQKFVGILELNFLFEFPFCHLSTL